MRSKVACDVSLPLLRKSLSSQPPLALQIVLHWGSLLVAALRRAALLVAALCRAALLPPFCFSKTPFSVLAVHPSSSSDYVALGVAAGSCALPCCHTLAFSNFSPFLPHSSPPLQIVLQWGSLLVAALCTAALLPGWRSAQLKPQPQQVAAQRAGWVQQVMLRVSEEKEAV